MIMGTRLRSWLRAMVHRSRTEREMDAELRFHIEAYANDLVRGGLPLDEALRRAGTEFGCLERAKEECREARRIAFFLSLAQDLRLGARMLRKSPGFTAVAVLTLALGIGANTAIFSVVDAVLLRPLPYPGPARLVRVWESYPARGFFRNVVNPLNFLDWQDNSKAFQALAAVAGSTSNLNAEGRPIAVPGLRVSPEFFSILEIPPIHGRTFTADDAISGHDHVVILSYELWQSQFAGNVSVIGQNMNIDGLPYTVIGVMPSGFSFPNTKAEVWTPLPLARTEEWQSGRYLTVVGRLKPGVTLEQARKDMVRVANIGAEVRPKFNKGWSAQVNPMLEDATQGVERPLWVLLASVALLLLIGCANVANLLLVRGNGRIRELAVRSALGASRWRLMQQLLVEGLMLSFAGMTAGLLLARFALYSVLALIPLNAPLPRSEPITIDGRVLLFTLLASLCTAVLFGLVPALRLSLDLHSALKQGSLRSGVGGHQMVRRCFVVAEVALALLLAVGAGLMLRSFALLISVDPGFQPERLLTMHISLSPSRYEDDLKRSTYFESVLTEIRSIPGVRAAGSTHFLPLTEMISGSCFAPGDGPPPTPAQSPSSQFLIVGSGYFPAMGIPVLRGRDFEPRDSFKSEPVAVVNHAFVERYFPGQDVLGKQLWVCWTIEKPVEIVGIAADTRQANLQAAPQPTIFLSNAQAPMYFATLVVRAEGDPRQIAHSVEDAIHRVDPDQAISEVQSMETVFSDSVSIPRFEAILLGAFAGLAVLLAVIGVYGIVSYSVSQRTNEIGIRVAMGAGSADIAGMVLREALTLAGIALLIGIGASLVLSRLLESLLFEVKPSDPLTLLAAACIILAVCAVAALVPARRAMRVDPMVALRYE
jgi:putative ABC transport system permease protein